jgi:hypothetical protein
MQAVQRNIIAKETEKSKMSAYIIGQKETHDC